MCSSQVRFVKISWNTANTLTSIPPIPGHIGCSQIHVTMTTPLPSHSHNPRILSWFPHQPPAPNNALEIPRQNVFITCETLRNMPAHPKHETGMVHGKNIMTSGRSRSKRACSSEGTKTNQGKVRLDWMKRVRARSGREGAGNQGCEYQLCFLVVYGYIDTAKRFNAQ
jgi:hypothetical protein